MSLQHPCPEYSHLIGPDGKYIPGTDIHTDYYGYKALQRDAQAARATYNAEAATRDRTEGWKANPQSNHEKPTPPSNQSKDRGVIKSRTFFKADHKRLKTYAKRAGNTIELCAQARDKYNEKYKGVLKSQGNLEGHLKEAEYEHKAAKNLHKMAAIHLKYSFSTIPNNTS
ncbi:hypothetical protein F5Y13DRAFT_189615 [Hypoxylon sp. FL1857]|nr:hypothetical protein F5Y13DRAFT_189615 [Hypoxylon sp. FL1857]